MTKKLIIDFVKLIAIFGAIWAAFIYIPWFPDTEDIKYPIEKEIELGEIIMKHVIMNDPELQKLNEPVVDSAIKLIEQRLIAHVGLTDYDYNIIVVENDMVNAFALPGGNIVVLSGLITFSESPEEVAAVLAHEIGHVEKRHVMKRLIKEFGVQLLFGALTGGDGIVLSEISRSAMSTYFDRNQEAEADDFALDLMTKANLEPKALGTIFSRMKRQNDTDIDLEYFTTHPHINSRIKKAFEHSTPKDFNNNPIEIDWEVVRNAAKKIDVTTKIREDSKEPSLISF